MRQAASCSPMQMVRLIQASSRCAPPISAPEQSVSLLGEDGHELRWIDRLSDLPAEARAPARSRAALREFMPEITRINQVSSFATPSKWQVSTNRGETELLLKAEDHIRRLNHTTLLITDGYGVSFLGGAMSRR